MYEDLKTVEDVHKYFTKTGADGKEYVDPGNLGDCLNELLAENDPKADLFKQALDAIRT